MKRIAIACILILSTFAVPALAQVSVGDKGTLKGTVFGDFYWIPMNHNESLVGNNGFWFRRVYLTYEREISDSFSSRLRLEMSSEGDFLTKAKMAPVVKDAYLKWKKGDHSIYAGISSTPTWGLVEDVWGYRSVEKSPLDLQDLGSSRDFGLSFKGTLGGDDRVGYHFMFGNGNSNKSEDNRGKKFMLALSYQLTEHWVVQAYGDINSDSGQDTYTTQGFLGYQSDDLNIGALYAYQYRNDALLAGDLKQEIASLFMNASLGGKTTALLRVDHMFRPNPFGEGIDYIPFHNGSESTLIVAGTDISLDGKVHLIPNIETVVYGKNTLGNRPGMDLIPRLTLLYKF